MLAHCSALPPENAAAPAAPPKYGALVSDALKKFKEFSLYSNFEISDLRWVHAATGWSWLTCVRYSDDHGHRRVYSFFINDNAVVNARYDILADRCGAQQYVPFGVTTGTVGSPTPAVQQPIY